MRWKCIKNNRPFGFWTKSFRTSYQPVRPGRVQIPLGELASQKRKRQLHAWMVLWQRLNRERTANFNAYVQYATLKGDTNISFCNHNFSPDGFKWLAVKLLSKNFINFKNFRHLEIRSVEYIFNIIDIQIVSKNIYIMSELYKKFHSLRNAKYCLRSTAIL